MVVELKGRDLISIHDLTVAEVEHLLDTALIIKNRQKKGDRYRPLEGKTLGMIFQKPSTRTRVSFEVGMWQLGGYALFLGASDLQLTRGENLADTARNLDRYLDVVMIRTFRHADVIDFADHCVIPVINGLTDLLHPCQALTDIFTIREKKGALQGLKLVYIGDGNNMAHSLMLAAAKTGLQISVCTPPGYGPDPDIVRLARDDALLTGAKIEILTDPHRAVEQSDIVYTDVWASMGMEQEQERRREIFAPYQVNAALLGKAASEVLVMHCLPAHRDEEITAEVMDGDRSIVFDQAENRLHVQKAILALLVGE